MRGEVSAGRQSKAMSLKRRREKKKEAERREKKQDGGGFACPIVTFFDIINQASR